MIVEFSRKFTHFNEFRESDDLLKHELGSGISYPCLPGTVVVHVSQVHSNTPIFLILEIFCH